MSGKSFVHLFILVLCCSTAAAQDKKVDRSSLSDFEGTWVVDKDSPRSKGNQTWTISVRGNVFNVVKDIHFYNSRRELSLRIDGKWEEGKESPGRIIRSRISWKKGKLVREYSYRNPDGRNSGFLVPHYSTANVIETYYLSDNGSKLVFRRHDDSFWPNRNAPSKMGRGYEDKIILRRKS